jgi:hypothetical protein
MATALQAYTQHPRAEMVPHLINGDKQHSGQNNLKELRLLLAEYSGV